MAMEVLTQMINRKAVQGKQGYHPRCKRLNLTHLVFADDLIILTYCSKASYRSICEVLAEFYDLLGLKFSPEKIEFFPIGITEDKAKSLAAIT